MKENTVTLTNDFHGTTTVVRTQVLDHGMHNEISLSRSQMDRAARKLCGIAECRCHGPAGIRGPQEIFGKTLIVNVFPRAAKEVGCD